MKTYDSQKSTFQISSDVVITVIVSMSLPASCSSQEEAYLVDELPTCFDWSAILAALQSLDTLLWSRNSLLSSDPTSLSSKGNDFVLSCLLSLEQNTSLRLCTQWNQIRSKSSTLPLSKSWGLLDDAPTDALGLLHFNFALWFFECYFLCVLRIAWLLNNSARWLFLSLSKIRERVL